MWGFCTRDDDLQSTTDDAELDIRISEDTWLITRMVDHMINMASFRYNRTLWLLRGWPSRSALMLSEDPNVQQSTVAQLQRDLKLFHTLEQSVADGTAPKYLLDRHAFHLKPVVQLVEIMRSTNWRITPEVSAWLRNFLARIMGSQVCEDGLKDCRQVEHDNQNRKANTKGLFHKMVCGNTLTERHHYSEPKASVSQYVRGAHLPDEAFHSSAKTATKDVSSVKGPSASTTWFSPSAERTSLPYADLDLLDLSYDEGADTFRPMSTAWMNTIIGGKGMVSARKGRSGGWCYCVPAEVEMCPRSLVKQWFLLPTSTCALAPIVVGDFEDWEAIPLLWLSPLGQERAMKTVRNNRKRKFFSVVAARAMCDPKISDGAALSVLKVAAHFAFWSQPAAVLKKLARHWFNMHRWRSGQPAILYQRVPSSYLGTSCCPRYGGFTGLLLSVVVHLRGPVCSLIRTSESGVSL